MNRFIFYDMQFRFPPQSLHAADIDLYTFLPSVLDGRQGVCLGVSILYLSLAQRLNLPLEIITPPGHIYVRYHQGDTLINIETTARGINTPSEAYLGINTLSLKQRPLKEVIGLAFMNQAAVYWTHEKYPESLQCYEKAILFMPNDPLLKMFFGFSCLFNGKTGKGVTLLKEVNASCFHEAVSKESIPEDYLSGKVDIEGIKAVFLPVDETRESILKKQKTLEHIVQRYPRYRAGLFHLATTWLQLGRTKEAIPILQKYHDIDPHNAVVEYYLSIVCLERLDYNLAWAHLKQLSSLLEAKQHTPPALLSLRQHLSMLCPERKKNFD
jgi:tetratricopeptide (TPR) repeat protein